MLPPGTGEDLESLAERIGHRFSDLDLLRQALTHTSYVNEAPRPRPESNERLEFLGDAVLGLITAEYLFHDRPATGEGDLTPLRAALVKGETLERVGVGLGLGASMRLGRGEEAAGGRGRASIAGRALEAIVGAIYLDAGYAQARAVVLGLLRDELARVGAMDSAKDERSRLQEIAQARRGQTPTYRQVDATGPSHDPTYTYEVIVGEEVLGRGQARSKQGAARAAAQAALREMGEETASPTADLDTRAAAARAARRELRADAMSAPTRNAPSTPPEAPRDDDLYALAAAARRELLEDATPVPPSEPRPDDPRRMRSRRHALARAVATALAAMLGTIWFLQGIGLLPGSFMSGDPLWAVLGAALVGLAAFATVGSRRPRR